MLEKELFLLQIIFNVLYTSEWSDDFLFTTVWYVIYVHDILVLLTPQVSTRILRAVSKETENSHL